MFRELLEAVREEASGERARASVAAISRFHRVQSSPGYDEAARWLEEALREDGLVPEREEVRGDGATRFLGILMPRGWECSRGTAILHDGGGREALCDYATDPLSLVLRSAPAAGTYPIVDVGDGTEAADYEGRAVRGAVVLSRGVAHRVHRLAVVERGATGILTDVRRLVPPVRGADDERDALNYTSFWWSEREERGWGFVVRPDTGDRLRARIADGAELRLEVAIESRDYAGHIPLVSTRVGPPGVPEVMVTAHLCHPLTSANDNGSGVAAALETARVLAALQRSGRWSPRERAVRFLWMPELTGTHAWLGREPGRAERLVAGLNLDMVGENQEACGSTLLLEHPPHFLASFAEDLLGRIRAEAPDWVLNYSGPGHYSMTRMAEVPYSGGSDHITYLDPAHGVPCPLLIQWPDRFYHSSHDTVEHTDPASLALAVRCAATYAGFLAAAGEAECEWVTRAVERGARARLLAALDRPSPEWAVARECLRGESAVRSIARLGVRASRVAEALESWRRFQSEHAGGVAPVEEAESSGRARVPSRRVGAPLDFQPHLWPGYETLPAPEREELRALIAGFTGGSTSLEVAWYACDGTRDLDQIGRLVAIERGETVPVRGASPGERTLERYFTLTGRLGLSEWNDPLEPSGSTGG